VINVIEDEGLLAEVTLPANLKGGDYLLRHEVIALHMAEALGGAEFFPSCIQITVTGNGTSTATQKEMAHFPGAYKSTDPGIHLDVGHFLAQKATTLIGSRYILTLMALHTPSRAHP
jgi:hypothetical protein